MASIRTAFALVSAGALVWVYCGTVLIAWAARPFFPEWGKNLVFIFLSSFLGGLYLLFLGLLSPLLAMETALFVSLVPVGCMGSGLPRRTETLDGRGSVVLAGTEALTLGGLIFALALIREPVGLGSLSLPGGARGIVELFNSREGAFFPVQVIAGSTGGFLLLGYGTALFRRYRARITREERQP
jgi:hypothetical protein